MKISTFKSIIFITAVMLIWGQQVFAVGAGITYHGRLIDPNGNPVVGTNVQFKLQIRTPGNENCLLYEEVQVKDLSQGNGVFSVTINDGTGTRLDSSGYAIDQIFANRGTFSFAGGQCVTGSSFAPNPTDGRKIQVYFNDGTMTAGTWEPSPPMPINFVPMAIESMQVGGYKKEQLLKLADGVTTTGSELDSTKWANLLALINGTSTAYTKPTDQVTQLYGAAIPTPSNGQSIRWNNTLNAGSGGWENFTAGSSVTVTSVTAGTGLNVGAGPGGSITTTGTLNIDVGTTTGKIVQVAASNKLPAIDGSNLTSINASSVGGTAVSLAALSNGQVLKYNGTNWVNATLTDNDTLGGLSCASGRVAYYSGSWSCLEVTSANTINTIVSRDGTGTSTFGTVNTGSLKVNNGVASDITLTTPAAFTSYAMKLPSTVGTNGYALTTDGGSPAQLSWSSIISSQWTTSGSNIYYNSGNVGIGITNPTYKLALGVTSAIDGIDVSHASGGFGEARVTPNAIALWPDAAGTNVFWIANTATDGMTALGLDTIAGASSNATLNLFGKQIITSRTNTTGVFQIKNAGGTVQFNVDTTTGNVGIGTAAATSPLTVVGAIDASSGYKIGASSALIKVGSTNWFFGQAGNTTHTGTQNTGGGVGSLANLTTGFDNTALGRLSLASITTGTDNTAMGYRAGMMLNGNANTMIGTSAMENSASGNNNTAVGFGALYSSSTGSNNTTLGYSSGGIIDTGSNNTLVGYNSGNTITSGSNNVIIGSNTGSSIATSSNNIIISDGSGNDRLHINSTGNVGVGVTSPQTTLQVEGVISPATNNTYTLGNATYRFTEVYATNGVINTSDRREKKDIYSSDLGLDFINKLRPVSYRWNTGVDSDIHYGLIAQEAEQAITEVRNNEKTSIVTHDETTDRYGVRYSELISPLIKAVQEIYNKLTDIETHQKEDKTEVGLLLKIANEKNKELEQRIEKLEKALNTK